MKKIPRVSLAQRTADHLREGLAEGRWKLRLPGIRTLAPELGVSQHTLRAAVGMLVAEGLLKEGESWEPYAILPRAGRVAGEKKKKLRVGILIHGPAPAQGPAVARIRTDLIDAGHDALFVSFPSEGKNKHNTGYLDKLVPEAKADAWVVMMATQENLAWFADRKIPALAIGGRGGDSRCDALLLSFEDALRELVRRLAALGHERIVLVCYSSARQPDYGPPASIFRDELAKCGIKPGAYHTPDWDESPEGLRTLSTSLFRLTPPTALICWPQVAAFATLVTRAAAGHTVPGDLSLFAVADDTRFAWMFPGMEMAHFEYDMGAYHRHILAWVDKVATGAKPRHRFALPAKLIEGNTLGPAKKR